MLDQRAKAYFAGREVDQSALAVDINPDIRLPAIRQPRVRGHRPARQQNVLVVVERRELMRGCLNSWLSVSCSEFETFAVAEVESCVASERLTRAAAALVCIAGTEAVDDWPGRQIENLRAIRPDLPIVVIAESEGLVGWLGVQGYIPTSSSVQLAAAALRLVVAGGRYFPAHPGRSRPLLPMAMDPARPAADGEGFAKLTRRESTVLNVLALGAPNKIIAYRLGMSLSTVKAHVHSIIRKLNVRNRTEAVVVARVEQGKAVQTNGNAILGTASQFASV